MKKQFLFTASLTGKDVVTVSTAWAKVASNEIFQTSVCHAQGKGSINEVNNVSAFIATGIINEKDVSALTIQIKQFLKETEISPAHASLTVTDAQGLDLN